MPGSTYKEMQGTSMAAPVVTGLAAILRSYFPSMTAPEVKNIILESVTKVDQKINLKTPEGNRKVFLDEISVAGGVANARSEERRVGKECRCRREALMEKE